jgi:hypothetical protein
MVHTCSGVGGLTELMRIAAMAGARGKCVVPHGYKTNITLAANLAFLSQLPRDEPAEYSTRRSLLRWRLTRKVLISAATGMAPASGVSPPGAARDLDPIFSRVIRFVTITHMLAPRTIRQRSDAMRIRSTRRA